MRRRTKATAAAALLVAALAGCGTESGSGESSSGSSASSSAAPSQDASPSPFDVTRATLTDQPFCDRLDPAEVGAVLGMAPDKVRVTTDRTVGDEYEGPVEEEGLQISDVNMCILGSATKQFIVTVQPVSSEGRVEKTIKDLAAMKEGYGQVCRVKDAPEFGTPGAVAACRGTSGSSRLVAVTTGMVGDSKFYCSAILNVSPKGTDLQGPLVKACEGILEELATA
jgi:hypothetical protein